MATTTAQKVKRAAYQREWRAKNPGRNAVAVRKWSAKNRERKSAYARKWFSEHPLLKAGYDKAQYVKNRERVLAREEKKRATPAGKSYKMASGAQHNYGKAALFVMDLMWSFQDGRDYITGAPLANPYLDHCHQSDLVRGLLNNHSNRQLGTHCGDSIPGCRARLLKLKNKSGKLAMFCRQAIDGLTNTPAMRMGLSFRIVGYGASLEESRTNRDYIEAANLKSVGDYMNRRELEVA